jgi:hypothetical protein
VLQLWQQTGGFDAEGLTVDQLVELLSAAGVFAVVAQADNQLVGAVLAAASASVGWIYRLSLLPGQPEDEEIAERLLAALARPPAPSADLVKGRLRLEGVEPPMEALISRNVSRTCQGK